eukprot:TRINITY_DN8783_c0_g1_i6.p3 TRINITY_DN8783_c0_g1~~TRINITY_DN8783_c0_g1_i6.p3  ORF type:complete len:117 (-),score=23.63 TRINITY_DN8783_c0_g1_i6:42-392(-)
MVNEERVARCDAAPGKVKVNNHGKGYPLYCEEHLRKAFKKSEEKKGGREKKRRSFRRAERWISRICRSKAKKAMVPPRLPPFIGAEQSSVMASEADNKTVRTVSYTHLTLPTICSV